MRQTEIELIELGHKLRGVLSVDSFSLTYLDDRACIVLRDKFFNRIESLAKYLDGYENSIYVEDHVVCLEVLEKI